MTSPRPTNDFEPELVLLLWGDAGDAVTRALLDGRAPLGRPLLAVSTQQLLDSVEFGATWTVAGRRVQPQRCALINRLPMADRLEPGDATAAGTPARQAQWSLLRDEMARFAYVSSLPTASSLIGCQGSLFDQWQDLPRLVPGLQVPEHSTPSLPRALRGDVFSVNRWTPYSLGQPLQQSPGRPAVAELPAASRLDYVRPAGQLVHLAQIGDTMFFPNPPPTMTPGQQQAMVQVARALAAVSTARILELAFFVGSAAPVLYSCCPVPVLSGGHSLYAELVKQGLPNDIRKWHRRDPV